MALLLTAAAVLGAGAPGVLGAVERLGATQQRLDDAALGLRATDLSHTLADERDVLVIVAATGDGLPGARLPEETRASTDRRIAGLAAEAPTSVRRALDTLMRARERALAGEAEAAETHAAYGETLRALEGLLRAGSTDGVLPDLATAADASAAARALLMGALGAGGGQRELTTLAQRETAREAAALDGFTAAAEPADRRAYRRALAGDQIEAAEGYLDQLTAAPELTAQAQALDEQAVGEALAARVDEQRAVLTSLAVARTEELDEIHQDALLVLYLRAALVAAALLLALVVSVRTARSLTRPLAAVRLGSRRVAADPEGQQPVEYVGRNDEFAEVVASVNALHARAVDLHRQASEVARDSGGLRAERDRLLAEQRELTDRLTALHGAVHGMFAHHAQRLLALVGEQLAVIEGLEEHETDPDQLAVLFALDHLAARMRRHGENLLLLAGAGPAGRPGDRALLVDVLRAAVSEIERYALVEIAPRPPEVHVVGPAARDVSHLLAELLDNATTHTPEGARVQLTGRWRDGELALTVADEGAGLSPERLAELNARLADPVTPPVAAGGGGVGLHTVARLAARNGLRCRCHARPGGGTIAEVLLPGALLAEIPGPGDLTDSGAWAVPGAPPGAVGTTADGAALSGHGERAETGEWPVPGGARPAAAGTPATGGGTGGTGAWHVAAAGGGGLPEPVPPADGEAGLPADGTAAGTGRTEAPGAWPVSQDAPALGGEQATGSVPAQSVPSPEHARADDSAPLTSSGLPLRTQRGQRDREAAPAAPAAPPAPPPGPAPDPGAGVSAEELRRRLDGFQRGAREGHRDAVRAPRPASGEETPS